MTYNIPRKRPEEASGKTYKIATGCGNMYIIVNKDDVGLLEVFATLGKTGQCGSAQVEGICRVVSIALRANVDPASIAKQLKGIRCPSPGLHNGEQVLSCSDAIAVALGKEIKCD